MENIIYDEAINYLFNNPAIMTLFDKNNNNTTKKLIFNGHKEIDAIIYSFITCICLHADIYETNITMDY